MSTSLHQYPPGSSLLHTPNTVDPQQHHVLLAQRTGPSSTNSLRYETLQFYHRPSVTLNGNAVGKPPRLPYASGPLAAAPRTHRGTMLHERSGRTSGPVRRRISRACDQCNQLRTKCDGQKPCSHCLEFGLTCAYLRERKKRGKASRKEIAQQQAVAAVSFDRQTRPSEDPVIATPQSQETPSDQAYTTSPTPSSSQSTFPAAFVPSRSNSLATTRARKPTQIYSGRTMSLGALDSVPGDNLQATGNGLHPPQPARIQTQGLPRSEYATTHDFQQDIAYQSPHAMMQPTIHPIVPSNENSMEYPGHPPIAFMAQSLPENASHLDFATHSPLSGSPTWMLPSPSATLYSGGARPRSSQLLRYPVLEPVVPYLVDIMPLSLACDLLELYFESSSSLYMQPVSPYVLGHVFRKNSFLRRDNPRACSPALLASMLWIGCLTSESPYLASTPTARNQMSEKLVNLTIGLLKPLVHQTPVVSDQDHALYSNTNMAHGITMGGFGMPTQISEENIGLELHFGNLDDVATYVNLGVVTSASEYKAASLRWWNAAWSLAREMRLGKEIVTPPPDLYDEDSIGNIDNRNTYLEATEEQREERRRMWWLLYTMDRHLALCYNRPLSFTDAECSGLLQPFEEHVWQSGDFFEDSAQSLPDPTFRRRGPAFECTGHSSIFEFFLPLMTILGEILDLTHARNHPRFGAKTDWDEYAMEISQRLDAYGRSLQDMQQRSILESSTNTHDAAPSHSSSKTTASPMAQESLMHARSVVTYGTYLMHTLHVLLNGKWDPISLLDDNDLWISSQSFVTATGHAVSAAEALNEILELDPDLSFMPFFFGIYLLQGSFLLLLIADKLQGEASPNIVRACEVIVRAHEACIVTLNTEYQRNFRNIMLSALLQMRGRGMQASVERRREMLSLYRWGDGTGLAL
ncbi:fungal-specific transcription factor domain-containing protein [Boeremia exigua]|uniref:fungal-specific transcription factor domain-containing protein n=1 Tax=Boeremia exigua TaxID=749465 RepID=UPI001E8D91E6|nr:fungal-specific transcription factor domain-containing protein [Boeremia exigua]KAH6614046.1 fungal-specific transcription factor domain-containing protein [Boeremia exigua]